MSFCDVKLVFGEAVRRQRFELGLSQEELAGLSGLHRTYISDVERGVRNVSLECIKKLAQALQLSVATLFSRAGDGGAPEEFIEILLVEDNPDDIAQTLRAFRKAKISNIVQVARDGADALDTLFATGPYEHRQRQPLPGVILLDLSLPKIGGLEVLRRIKADERMRTIPIVALTSSSRDQDLTECRRLGVESYLVKPVGFRNFSEAMPDLQFHWALLKRPKTKTGDDGSNPAPTGDSSVDRLHAPVAKS